MGAYRDDDGKPYVLPSVLAAEAKMMEQGINKEYAGMQGVPAFVTQSLKFAVRPPPSRPTHKGPAVPERLRLTPARLRSTPTRAAPLRTGESPACR